MMKASDYIVKFLESQNITHVFGYQGGMITHLVDSLSKSKVTKFIQCYHEQSAAIAAEGYARESGKFGVAISTSGPGATNMLTGIADAFFDSVPVLYITGQVNTYEYKYDKAVRQLGFQETDIVSMVKPVTKYAVLISEEKKLAYELEKAVHIAMSGRKGPVLIDLPMDIQRSDVDAFKGVPDYYPNDCFVQDDLQIESAWNAVRSAKKLLVLCGSGVKSDDSKDSVSAFLQTTQVPYVVSLLGKGAVDEYSPNFIGMIGSYGNRCANIVFSQSDVVLVLGSRLDLRQTGDVHSENLRKIKFIHIDIDEDELKNSRIENRIDIHSTISDFLKTMPDIPLTPPSEWVRYCNSIRNKYSQTADITRFLQDKTQYTQYTAVCKISCSEQENVIYSVDIGQNQMWTAQSIRLKNGDSFWTSGGLAPMGYALPAAVGAAFACPSKKVICIAGDGGFHFALQSLQLISQYKLNISIYVLNNHSLGMITQFQTLYFNSNMAGTTESGGYVVPDLKKIAEAYGLQYQYIADIATEKLLPSVPQTIYEVRLPELTSVVPKLEYNQPLYNMLPYLSKEEIDRLQI
jgi:acetolactate synthase I/II/III large subunit